MGRKGKETMTSEPAVVDGLMAGVMDEDGGAAEGAHGTDGTDGTHGAAEVESGAVHELGTDDPGAMTLASIDSEIARTESPSEYLTRARREFEARLAEIERERDELKTIENVAHTDYHAAQKFAHELAKRRQALTNERKRRG
jgi:hypothetical protein